MGKKEPTVSVTTVPATPDSGSDSAVHIIAPPSPGPSDEELNQDPDYIPDGGAVAWRQVLAGHLGNVVAASLPAIFGIFQLYYTTTLALPASTISWIGSVQLFVNNCSCVVGGRLADAGLVRESVLAGSVLVALGVFMTSLSTQYWQILLAQGVCTGVGLGLIWMPCTAVVSSYFKKRRSFALSLASAGSGTGSMAFPAIVQYLMPSIGFAWAVRCLGLVVLATMVLLNLLLKPRLVKPRTKGPFVDVEAFKEPTYLIFAIGTFLLYWALYFGFFYVSWNFLTIYSRIPQYMTRH